MFHAISFKDLREANVFIYFGRNIVYEELSLKQQDLHAYIYKITLKYLLYFYIQSHIHLIFTLQI